MVKAIAGAMEREPSCQFAFYGHSLGAIIGFELARELRRRRRTGPTQLFLSGQQAPQVANAVRPIFNLPDDEFIAELRRLNGTPEQLLDDPEMQEILLPILRADFEILDNYKYRHERPLSCPITVYGGQQDDGIPVKNLHAWKEQTLADCNVEAFPGDHFFIRDPRSQFIHALQNDILDIVGQSRGTRKLQKKR